MTAIALVLAGLGLVALPALLRPRGRSLVPRRWALLCSVALAGGAAVFEAGLLLYAAPTALAALGVPALAAACQRLVSGVAPGGEVAGWAAGAVAVAAAGSASVSLLRGRNIRRLARVEPCLGEHRRFGSYELVVLKAEETFAFSVDGDRGQIVVSSGLVDTLTEDELAVVLAHEAAHLDYGHRRYLSLAGAVRLGLVFFPLASKSASALLIALERWADETALGAVEQGRDHLRSALLRVTGSMVGVDVAAFSAVDTVAERLEAIGTPPPKLGVGSFAMLYTPGVVLGLVSTSGLGAWIANFRMLAAATGHCPV